MAGIVFYFFSIKVNQLTYQMRTACWNNNICFEIE